MHEWQYFVGFLMFFLSFFVVHDSLQHITTKLGLSPLGKNIYIYIDLEEMRSEDVG
jgi:hypothetical protein